MCGTLAGSTRSMCVPPKVKLAACEESALEIVNLEDLKKHQIEDV